MPFEPGKQFGRYRVVRLIAQGGMAEVYRADQELAGGILRPVALKVIRPEYSESADFREMFLDEARCACTLSHPNIVHIYEVGDEENTLFMAMELVPGESLAVVSRKLKDAHERLPDEGLLAVGVYTCSALEAVHALQLAGSGHVNLVHRDVSPHNLLLSSSGSLKLIDFGIAKAATNRNLTSPGVTKGKAGYFSPEQAMGLHLDGRSDLFSLGVTLYKLACGQTPFDHHKDHLTRNQALVHGQWKPLREVFAGLPRGFYDVLDRALALKPEHRFSSAREMREALEGLAVDLGIHVGQSSLQGYVDDDGIVSSPSQKMAAIKAERGSRPATQAVRLQTQRLGGTRAGSLGRRRALVAGAVLGALVVAAAAVGIVRWMTRSVELATDEVGPAIEVDAGPLAVPLPTMVVVGPSEPMPEPRAEVEPETPPAEPVSRPRPRPTPVRVARGERPTAAKGTEAAAIPKGDGILRIGAVPDGQASIDRRTWESVPVNKKKIASGAYDVYFRRGDKTGTCHATVLPDRTTIVQYNFSEGACQLQ